MNDLDEDSDAFLKFQVTGRTLVVISGKLSADMSIKGPTALGSVLSGLDSAGFGKLRVQGHSVEKDSKTVPGPKPRTAEIVKLIPPFSQERIQFKHFSQVHQEFISLRLQVASAAEVVDSRAPPRRGTRASPKMTAATMTRTRRSLRRGASPARRVARR